MDIFLSFTIFYLDLYRKNSRISPAPEWPYFREEPSPKSQRIPRLNRYG